jgi:excisionase family DNA binding protein
MDRTALEPQLEPLLVTAEQAAALLAICRTKVYELLRNGELESVQIGSSRRIAVASLSDYVVRLQARARGQADTSPLPPTVP